MELLTNKGLKIPNCFKNNFVEVRCLLLGEIIEQKRAKNVVISLRAFRSIFGCHKRINVTKHDKRL